MVSVVPVDLEFGFENLSVEDLIAGEDLTPLDEPIDIYRESIGTPGTEREDLGSVAFDYNFSGEIGLGLDLDTPTLGEASLQYPVDATLILPDFVEPGNDFQISTGNDFSSVFPELTAESLNFGSLAFDIILQLDEGGLSNISFSNPLNVIPGVDLPDISVPGDLTYDAVPETTVTLVEISPGFSTGLEGQGIFDDIELNFTSPEGEENTSVGEQSPAGTLETVMVELEEPLVTVNTNPLELLANIPALRLLDVLQEDRDFSFLGFDLTAEYTIVGFTIEGGYGIIQEFEFDPGDVSVAIDIGGIQQIGRLGDSFNFSVPDNAENSVEGTVEYGLTGTVDVSYAIAPIGSIGYEVLQGSLAISEGNEETEGNEEEGADGVIVDVSFGPLFEDSISGSSDFGSFEIFSSDFTIGADALGSVTQEFVIPVGASSGEVVVFPPNVIPPSIAPPPELEPGGEPLPGTPQPTPNTAPVATADAATTGLSEPIAIDVLANDTDADGTLAPESVTVTTEPEVGTAVAQDGGTILYTPEDDLSVGGPEGFTTSFAYTVDDNDGATSDPATVTVTVENAPPVAVADAAETDTATPVEIEVLANDTDDGNALDPASVTVTNEPDIGTAESQDDGTVLYTPDDDIFLGDPEGYTTDFAYTVADTRSATSDPATVTVAVERLFDLVGTDGNDRLRGPFENDDEINGLAGDDILNGGFGIDLLVGGEGNDTLDGGPDRDRLEGGEGDDRLESGDGDDLLNGGEGDDDLRGGFGEDVLNGNAGIDEVRGEGGSDRLIFSDLNSDGKYDLYDGGLQDREGADTLVLELEQATFDDPLFQSELGEFQDTFDDGRGGYIGTFDFNSLGLTALGFEEIEISVNGAMVEV